jgi:hypothetical protein
MVEGHVPKGVWVQLPPSAQRRNRRQAVFLLMYCKFVANLRQKGLFFLAIFAFVG